MALRFALLLAAGLLAAVAVADSAVAMRDLTGGCGEDAIVEACFPVCVTEPCPSYVCVHLNQADVCRELG